MPRHTRSKALQQRAEQFFPGGVNSPVRAFKAVGGSPPFVDRAKGAYLIDVDGGDYIDYFWFLGPDDPGPRIYSPVVEAIGARGAQLGEFLAHPQRPKPLI